jgi:hypothetical protein
VEEAEWLKMSHRNSHTGTRVKGELLPGRCDVTVP